MRVKVNYKIRSIRTARNMTLQELSDLSGVSTSQISDIERNLHDATVSTICCIADALGLEPQELFEVVR